MTVSEDMIFLSTYFRATYDTTSYGTLVGETLKEVKNVTLPAKTQIHIMNFVTLCKGRLFVSVACESNMSGSVSIRKGEETVASGTMSNERVINVPVTVEKGDIFSIYVSNSNAVDNLAASVEVMGKYVTNGYAIGLVR